MARRDQHLELLKSVGWLLFVSVGASQGQTDLVVIGVCFQPGQVAGDDEGAFTTVPGGFWMDLNGKRLYHAGDTALLMDMQLLKGKVDVALLPIGDNFTMGPDDALRAVKLIEPRRVVPIHYNTFDVIRQDPQAWAKQVEKETAAKVAVLKPGGFLEL